MKPIYASALYIMKGAKKTKIKNVSATVLYPMPNLGGSIHNHIRHLGDTVHISCLAKR